MNHYELLQVSPSASPTVIRAAYKSLMQRHHPDKSQGDASAGAHSVQLTQAYTVLSDDLRRAAYDSMLRQQQLLSDPHQRIRSGTRTRPASALPRSQSTASAGSSAYAWLLGAVIAVSCLTIYFLNDMQHETTGQRVPPTSHTQPTSQLLHSYKIELLSSDLDVQLRPLNGSEPQTPHLIIPALTLEVRSMSSDPLLVLPEERVSALVEQLSVQLSTISARELQIHGSDYLREFIRHTLVQAAMQHKGAMRESGNAEAQVSYDITGVTLPESFFLQ